jgi:hypothetical protein
MEQQWLQHYLVILLTMHAYDGAAVVAALPHHPVDSPMSPAHRARLAVSMKPLDLTMGR